MFRQTLSTPGLLAKVRQTFGKIKELRKKKADYSLQDVLMSGLAIFEMKYTSLLKFDEQRKEKRTRHNLRQLYDVEEAPCDSQLRDILDPVNPKDLRPTTVNIIQEVQRQGALENYRHLGGLISMDGTGHFSSGHISCPD